MGETAPGDSFGPYEIRGRIGTSGNLFAAADTRTAASVTLRLYDRLPTDDPGLRERLGRMPLLQDTLPPAVLHVIAYGEIDGVPYLAMESLSGLTLRETLDRSGAISLRRALGILRQVADALTAIHEAGLVHHEIDPDAVLVGPDDEVRLLGFGLAAPNLEDRDDVAQSTDIRALSHLLAEMLGPSENTPPALDAVLASNPGDRYGTPRDFVAAVESAASPAPDCVPGAKLELALPFHDDVQFTVYRPRALRPLVWTPLLAFAHLGDAPLGTDPEDDPIEQVARRARAVLGNRIEGFAQVTQDSAVGLPEESDLTFELELPGFEIRSPRRTFAWLNAVHMEEFQIRAGASASNARVRGRLLVMHGNILLAEVRLAIAVDPAAAESGSSRDEPVTATAFRKIFPSYSHHDTAIVMQFERYIESLGDQYLRDVYALRSGEQWQPRLRELIAEADVFQLFWSRNAMDSSHVEEEWRYALSLNRSQFIRPTYWEEPMPTRAGLPPVDLGRIHFHPLGTSAGKPVIREAAPAPPPPAPPAGPPPTAPPPPAAAQPSTLRKGGQWAIGLVAGALVASVGVVGIQALSSTSSAPPNTLATGASSTVRVSTLPGTPGVEVPPTPGLTFGGDPFENSPMNRLIRLLPPGVEADECAPEAPALGALAAVRCAGDSNGVVDDSRYSLVDDPTTLNELFDAAVAMAVPCPGARAPTPSSWGVDAPTWQRGGLVACGAADGHAVITWTESRTGVLGVVRGDYPAMLYQWWLRSR